MPLPSQSQLHGYYVARCGYHEVLRPHRAALTLLAEDTASHAERLTSEAAERCVAVADLEQIEDRAEGAARARERAAVTPLAAQRAFRLAEPGGKAALSPLYIGARGLLPILDLIAELPLLETVDLSNVASWYDNDTFAGSSQGSVSGNDVVAHLCTILPRLRFLHTLDLGGQPLGSIAVAHLLETIRQLPTVVRVNFDTTNVDPYLIRAFQQTLEEHQLRPRPHMPTTKAVAKAYEIPLYITALPRLDRKTLREQQVLRALLSEDPSFTSAVTGAEMSDMVLTARVMSTAEAVFRCGDKGIRGDGQHLFILKSGTLRVYSDLEGFVLSRGDYFGDSYPSVLLPCSRLEEEERGIVYAIPLCSSTTVLAHWAARLVAAWPWLHQIPIMHAVGAWTCMRACTCSEFVVSEPTDTIVEAGDGGEAIYVVCDGSFSALDSRGGDAARYNARRVRSVFTRLDVFGIEALVARKRQSSVRIKAGKEKDVLYRTSVVRGCGVRVLHRQLRPVFISLARGYSLHEDLCAGGTTG
ncbi:conserved hypothetical protein [Leishmania major strain Friedlin]|uniref:Cyclic nucleotide-binding domain-containing protein n=1 Tax=Leishmania major TaxID=5664 RepID=Q4QBF9_LEIMA|nr:conserved hypothetical protein [Leishmania major strain Friedlin]CAG9574098.1 hypothetical_protein_-_conserved [Leishmania major strain Friedlin]CAJ03913.1 conserved hypothetical protein [Leishmania major strain Friedlin]|eukprot:XP_001683339.1 conserved hypothetical protein [Leishmania major strain Friedlin]